MHSAVLDACLDDARCGVRRSQVCHTSSRFLEDGGHELGAAGGGGVVPPQLLPQRDHLLDDVVIADALGLERLSDLLALLPAVRGGAAAITTLHARHMHGGARAARRVDNRGAVMRAPTGSEFPRVLAHGVQASPRVSLWAFLHVRQHHRRGLPAQAVCQPAPLGAYRPLDLPSSRYYYVGSCRRLVRRRRRLWQRLFSGGNCTHRSLPPSPRGLTPCSGRGLLFKSLSKCERRWRLPA